MEGASKPSASPPARCAYEPFVGSGVGADQDREAIRGSLRRSYDPVRSGNVVVVLDRYDIFTDRPRGTSHGSPWDYDRHIPLVLYGSGVRGGAVIDEPAASQDIAPTLAHAIGCDAPAAAEGRVLGEALEPDAPKPRLAVVMVLDQVPYRYLEEYRDALPTVRAIAAEGATYTEMRSPHLPTSTAVGHAAIGTGAYPAATGIVGNDFYDPGSDRIVYAVEGSSPRFLRAETLADAYGRATGNLARVVSVGGADRAAIGMAGHGAMLPGADRDDVFWFDPATGRFATNEAYYRMPGYLADMDIMDHTSASNSFDGPEEAKASPALDEMLGEALVRVLDREGLGSRGVCDLLYVNFKSPDYVGHVYGPGPELFDALEAVDRTIARVKERLDAIYGGEYLLVITADHGAAPPPEDTGGRRVDPAEFVGRLRSVYGGAVRFSVDSGGLMNLYLDEEALASQGRTLGDVKRTLESYDEVSFAFTRDELA